MSAQNIKQNLKFTSLFGGVQLFNIIVTIIRSKIVAILIGPIGVGIMELYTTTTNLISSLTTFSLGTSAVRNISIAHNSGNIDELTKVSSIFSNIVWITGFLGSFLCLVGAPLWSIFTFGDYNHTIEFACLSVVFILGQISTSKQALLQGTRKFKYLAYSSIIGNLLGLCTTVPIYYILGIKGIVCVIILSSISSFLLALHFGRKLHIPYIKVSLKETISGSKNMLRQGFLLSLNVLLGALLYYVLRLIINHKGGTEELGLYSASLIIITRYVGLITQSMVQEYYPRLSSLASDGREFNNAINDQISLSLFLAGPLVCLFITFSPEVLYLLYSDKFLTAKDTLVLLMFGVLYQLPSFCMGYAFLAKGDNKAFMRYEIGIQIIRLFTDISLYLIWGLPGLGISFIFIYICYTIQCVIVCKKRYSFFISSRNILYYAYNTIAGSLVLTSFFLFPSFITWIIGTIVSCIIGYHSYLRINEYINLYSLLCKKIPFLEKK